MNELVLDMGDYIGYHPGGRFVLEKNVGRDISKFYCGSYSILEDLSIVLHTHGRQADWQVYQMIIGTVEGQKKGAATVAVYKERQLNENSHTATFHLHAFDETKKDQYKRFHNSLNHVGQYYIINAKADPYKKRQYTVCNMLIPEIKEAGLALIKSALGEKKDNVDPMPLDLFMDEGGQHGFYLTVK